MAFVKVKNSMNYGHETIINTDFICKIVIRNDHYYIHLSNDAEAWKPQISCDSADFQKIAVAVGQIWE